MKINRVLSKRLRVLTEAKSFEPLRNVVRHGDLLRQAGFAEAIQQVLHIIVMCYRKILVNEGYRNSWPKF